jgi:23S rRNA pseudouridine2605 synthase
MERCAMEGPGIRLQKFLASCGVGSRRSCEDLIVQGRVTVDGEAVRVLGTRVDPETQRIKVDGETMRAQGRAYFLVNKPRGYLCSNAPQFEPKRVIDLVPGAPAGVFPAGRLDLDSEGLVFVTNDGEAANRLVHPRYGVPKTYRVQVRDRLTPEALDRLREGVFLAEGKVVPKSVELVGVHENRTEADVVLMDGLNRVVRRIFAKVGHPVKRLTRTAIGPFRLDDIPPGRFRRLDPGLVASLLEKAGTGEKGGESPAEKPFRNRKANRPRRDAVPGGGRKTGTGSKKVHGADPDRRGAARKTRRGR